MAKTSKSKTGQFRITIPALKERKKLAITHIMIFI